LRTLSGSELGGFLLSWMSSDIRRFGWIQTGFGERIDVFDPEVKFRRIVRRGEEYDQSFFQKDRPSLGAETTYGHRRKTKLEFVNKRRSILWVKIPVLQSCNRQDSDQQKGPIQ